MLESIITLVLGIIVGWGLTELLYQDKRIANKLGQLIEKDQTMAVTLQQLDAAIAAETQENATLVSTVTQLDTDVTNLIAKIQAGQDFTNELNAVQANISTITGVVTAAAAEDASVQGQLNPPSGTAKPS